MDAPSTESSLHEDDLSSDDSDFSDFGAPLSKIPRLSALSEMYDHRQLLRACEIGDCNAIAETLAKQASLSSPSRSFSLGVYKNPMCVAAKYGHLEVVKLLRSAAKDIPIPYNVMLRAVKYGHIHLVDYFLQEGFPIDHPSLVSDCVRFSQTAVLQFLLSKGAKLVRNSFDQDPLLIAPAWLGDYEMCRLLVDQRVDLRETSVAEGNTPLLQAVTRGASGNEAIVDLFLEHGADVNHVNRFGYTAFDLADENCFTRIGLRLFEGGAKVNALESSEALFISRPYVPPPAPIIPSATGCVVRSDGVWMSGRIPGVNARSAFLQNNNEPDLDEDEEQDQQLLNQPQNAQNAQNSSSAQLFDLWRLEKESSVYYLGTPLVLEGGADGGPPPTSSFAHLGNYLQVDPLNSLTVEKIAKSMVASLMRVGSPIDFLAGPLSYFEIEVICGGGVSAIAIGVVSSDYDSTRLPGWQPISFAYHGDNGYRFASVDAADSQGHPYGPPAKVGDVMGVGVLHSTCEVFFTHNGRFLGVVGLLPSPASSSSASSARTKQPTPSSPSPNDPNGGKPFHFHPLHLFHFAVGLRSVGEKITANFGQKPFRFNFEVESLRWHRGNLTAQCARKIRRLQVTSATWLVRGSSKCLENNNVSLSSEEKEEEKKNKETSSSSSSPLISVVPTIERRETEDPPLYILSTTGLVVFDPRRKVCEWRDYASGVPTSDQNPFFRILQLDERRAVAFAIESGYNFVYLLDLCELRWSYFAAGGIIPVFGANDDLMDTVNVANGKVFVLWPQRANESDEDSDDDNEEEEEEGGGGNGNGNGNRNRSRNKHRKPKALPPSYLFVLDLETRLWERLALPKMIARDHMEGASLMPSSLRHSSSSSRMIYFGGWDRHSHTNAVQILDLSKLQWQRVHTYGYTIMKPRSQVNICTVTQNRVISVGGWDGMQAATDVDVIEFKAMSSLRHPLAVAFDCDENLSDVTVIVGSRRVPLKISSGGVNSTNAELRVRVHRVVLCCRSAFFRSKLLEMENSKKMETDSEKNANSSNEFQWEGPSARAGRLLLEFLYSDVMAGVRIEDAAEVLYWAKALFPEHLTRITEFVIMTRIGVNSTMSTDLQWALNNRIFADITFDVMGTLMRYHKVLLTTLSDYFRALLRGHFRESRSEIIHRPDVEPAVFEMLIQFLYTRRVEVTGENAMQLLALANRYNVRELRDVTEDSLAASVTLENCCFLLAAADLQSCSRLKKVCLDFASRHFGAAIASKAIGFSDLSDLLQKELVAYCIS